MSAIWFFFEAMKNTVSNNSQCIEVLLCYKRQSTRSFSIPAMGATTKALKNIAGNSCTVSVSARAVLNSYTLEVTLSAHQ